MTADKLAAIAGVLLSLIFAYVPKLNDKYAALDGVYKRLIMAGLLLVVSLGAFGLACVAPDQITFLACTKADAWSLAWTFIAALVANQGAFTLLVQPKGDPASAPKAQ
jgi:hypothetical protein